MSLNENFLRNLDIDSKESGNLYPFLKQGRKLKAFFEIFSEKTQKLYYLRKQCVGD